MRSYNTTVSVATEVVTSTGETVTTYVDYVETVYYEALNYEYNYNGYQVYSDTGAFFQYVTFFEVYWPVILCSASSFSSKQYLFLKSGTVEFRLLEKSGETP